MALLASSSTRWPLATSSFETWDALCASAQSLPEVPDRKRMRLRQKPSEAWLAVRYPLALAPYDSKPWFPLLIESGERPDVVLSLPENTVGLELTEAIHEQFSQALSLAERWGLPPPDCSLFRHDYHYSEPDLERLVREQHMGDGFTPLSAVTEWLAQIKTAINRKVMGRQSPGYRTFDAQELLVYDNTGVDLAPHHALEALKHCSADDLGLGPFDKVGILTGAVILEVQVDHCGKLRCTPMRLPDSLVR